MYPHSTISLIGMPGAGKSTVGVLLAKRTGLRFCDTDLEIQVRAGATLQDILEREGHLALRHREQDVLLDIDLNHAVISTGGSAVYSDEIMARLAAAGPLVYLQVELNILQRRVAAAPDRGIASSAEQTFEDVYLERTPLYQRHAQYTVDANAGTPDQISKAILAAVAGPSTPSRQ